MFSINTLRALQFAPFMSPRTLLRLRLRRCLTTVFILAAGQGIYGYVFHGYSWPAGTQVQMHLQLDGPAVSLQDGSASWNDSAADALLTWNQYMETVQFVVAPPASAANGDGVNNVFFANEVYGMSWPPGTLAVTLSFSPYGNSFRETDVVFNDNLKWNSYRGPAPGGTWDLHRVALHEFGHVVGLDHPDQHGQDVVAIMNSIIGNLDHLTDDDIAGARALYPARITSPLTAPGGSINASYSYQITASNNPTSFDATGLPAGLQLNTSSGLISGSPTVAGTFDVLVTAHGPHSDVSATVRITIAGPVITSPTNPSGVAIGNNFTYQITASANSTSYSATGLPPGLELNTSTGLISGVPTISGTYLITVIARGPYGDASTRITVTFAPNPTPRPYDSPSVTLPVGKGPIVTDSVRSRIYVGSGSSIAVVNTAPPQVAATVPVGASSTVKPMALSRDNKILWFLRGDGTIGRLDLETLQVLANFPTSEPLSSLREGLNNRVYGASANGGVVQLDATTGALQGRLVTASSGCSVEINPDGKSLYVGLPFGAGIRTFDVSGPSPVLLQSYQHSGPNGYLRMSPDGARLSYWTGEGTTLFGTTDIEHPLGVLPTPYYAYDGAIFAQDNALIFQFATPALTDPKILIYDPVSGQVVRTISLPARSDRYRILEVDPSNTYLMTTAGDSTPPPGALLFYSIVPHGPTALPHSLLNVSTRMRTQGGDSALIGGFIINGQDPKQIVVRAMGPSLPVAGKLADPVLQLFNSAGALVDQNDNWNSYRANVIATGIPPADEHEAVITANLQPGSYTAVVRGVNGATGVALVEAYDLSPNSNSRLANISTRGKVEAGDNVMIGGFIIAGDQETDVVVRAIGPSLAGFGLTGVLSDPMLEVYNGNGTLLSQDDDWRMDQEQALIDTGLAPTDDREAALLMTLQPGAYTAIVRGKSDGVGVGVVEVYNLDAK